MRLLLTLTFVMSLGFVLDIQASDVLAATDVAQTTDITISALKRPKAMLMLVGGFVFFFCFLAALVWRGTRE